MSEETRNEAAGAVDPAVTHRQGRVSTPDHLDLLWNAWTPETPRGVVVIVHGLAEHSGRYRETAEFISGNGLAVYAFDLRSHGLSPDPPGAGRVHVDRFEDYYGDVGAMIGLAREAHGNLPLFLLGHSMGGLICIRYVLDHPDGLTGAIISSPALATHPEYKPALFLRLLVGLLSRLAPRLLVPSELDTGAISRDPAVVKAYVEDPLVSSKVSARWYSELTKSMKTVFSNAARLRIPMLLMQSGADRLVDPDAPGRWAAAAPSGLVDLQVWEGLYHEMFNEPEKDQVRARVIEWIDARQSA